MSGANAETVVEETQGAPETAAPEVVSETPAPAAPAQPEPEPAAPAMVQDANGRMVPLAGYLDERDRRQAAERKAAELEARERQREQQRRAQPKPHVLDDPEGYDAYMENRVRSVEQTLQSQLEERIERLSRASMRRAIGADKMKELDDFIAAAPDRAHEMARQDDDPYAFFYEHYQRAQEQKRLLSVKERLGDKDLDAYLEEQKQKWLAENAASAAVEAPSEAPGQPRQPNGQFASPSQPQQRRSAPSLASVGGVATARGSEPPSGYDAAFRRG